MVYHLPLRCSFISTLAEWAWISWLKILLMSSAGPSWIFLPDTHRVHCLCWVVSISILFSIVLMSMGGSSFNSSDSGRSVRNLRNWSRCCSVSNVNSMLGMWFSPFRNIYLLDCVL